MLKNNLPNLKVEYYPLVEFITKKTIHEISSNPNFDFSKEELNNLFILIDRAQEGVPISYLTHKAYFYKDEFYVDNNVLIPRPETEYLVDESIKHIKALNTTKSTNIVDVCTGSGCVGLSIAKYVSSVYELTLMDISTPALEVCRINAQKLLRQDKNITILKSDLLKMYSPKNGSGINVLISNPPYIPRQRIPTLEKSVRDFEPHIALDGGNGGYEITMELLRQAKDLMDDKFLILIEIDEEWPNIIEDFAKNLFPTSKITIERDLFGKNRYLRIKL